MDNRVFEAFRKYVHDKSGIALRPGKESLVSSRVARRMRVLDITVHEKYLDFVKKDTTGKELTHLIDAISTNTTSFYREPAHFKFLEEHLRKWTDAGVKRFRIWCAAASSGEEPYTLAMTMQESTPVADKRILATDISSQMISACKAGVYTNDRLDGIPKSMIAKYFTAPARGGDQYVAKETLKKLLLFKRLNLAEPPFPMRGPLDMVFCRNVMIYFDTRVKTNLVNEAYRLLKPGGFLVVGHTESLSGLATPFQSVQPSIYIKRA